MNHTNDGFLNSILNDEDLQLMDMAVNEGKFVSQLFSYQKAFKDKKNIRHSMSRKKWLRTVIKTAYQ